jgi:hypothetical protein
MRESIDMVISPANLPAIIIAISGTFYWTGGEVGVRAVV